VAPTSPMPPPAVTPPPSAEPPLSLADLAPRWRRILATLIDWTFAFVIATAVAAAVLFALQDGDGFVALGMTTLAWMVTGAVVAFSNEALGEGRTGQTYGKNLVRIRVVHDPDRPGIGIGRAAIRSAIKVVGWQVFALGIAWIAWDPYRRGWHDLAATTAVVSTDRRRVDPVRFIGAWLTGYVP
jgi:uncharacterized RDD family membrane protein YckC